MREMHSKRPKFSKFSGGACPRTPLEARAVKTPSASFNISPPTSQILPSTPFLIENPAVLLLYLKILLTYVIHITVDFATVKYFILNSFLYNMARNKGI